MMKLATIYVAILGVIVAGCERDKVSDLPGQNQHKIQPREPEPTEADRNESTKRVADWIAKSSENYVEVGWHQIPTWAADLPFDLKSQIDVSPGENRESAWINAFLEFSLMFREHFPNLRNNREQFVRFSKLQSANLHKAIDFYFDQVNRESKRGRRLSPDEIETAKELLVPFQAGFKKLDASLERPRCFFHSNWETNAYSASVLEAPSIQYLMALHFQTRMLDIESLRMVEIGLQLLRDLARLPQLVDQISLSRLEKSIFQNMVHLALDHEDLSDETLDRLISILKRHQLEYWETDPFVEVTRREILDFRHLFHQLTDQSYVTPQRTEDLFLAPNAEAADLLLRQVVDLGFYGINTEQVKTETISEQ